jgi:hypothetical protein
MQKFRFVFLIALALLVANSMQSSQNSKALAQKLAGSAQLSFLAIQAASAPSHSANPADQLPLGEGRDVTVRVCSQCHSVSNFVQKRYTEDRWDTVLDDMIAKGMQASDDDLDTVKKYLITHLAPDSQNKNSSDPKSN